MANRHVKQTKKANLHILVLIISVLSAQSAAAAEHDYRYELGVQAGMGYYVGDATPHIFNHPREAAGIQFRYKFDQRWALQAKMQTQNMAFPLLETHESKAEIATNRLYALDVVGEFNFFRFGEEQYDERVRPLTPYLFLGVGVAAYSNFGNIAAYFPFGIGMKWKFANCCGLNIAWQQNLYFADNLENKAYYNNTHGLNGSNILKNDFTSSLTIGIVFEFGKRDKICRHCD